MQNLFLYLLAKGIPVKYVTFLRSTVVAAVQTSCTNTVCSNRQQNLWIVLLKMQQRFCHMFGEVGTVTMSAKKAGTKPMMGAEFIQLHLFL